MTGSVRLAPLPAAVFNKGEERIERRDGGDSADAKGNRTHNGHDIHIGTANLIAPFHQSATIAPVCKA